MKGTCKYTIKDCMFAFQNKIKPQPLNIIIEGHLWLNMKEMWSKSQYLHQMEALEWCDNILSAFFCSCYYCNYNSNIVKDIS